MLVEFAEKRLWCEGLRPRVYRVFRLRRQVTLKIRTLGEHLDYSGGCMPWLYWTKVPCGMQTCQSGVDYLQSVGHSLVGDSMLNLRRQMLAVYCVLTTSLRDRVETSRARTCDKKRVTGRKTRRRCRWLMRGTKSIWQSLRTRLDLQQSPG